VRGRRLAAILFAVAAAAFVLDRVTKAWAVGSLRGRPAIVLIPHVLDLSYTTNSGGAFSLLTGAPWLFFVASIAISAGIVWLAFRQTSLVTAIGMGLILGGALGNLADRLTRGSGVSGRVVDFIHLHMWPTFNVADSCVVIGAIVVAAGSVFQRKPTGPDTGAQPAGGGA
jgi:signal peptidase II